VLYFCLRQSSCRLEEEWKQLAAPDAEPDPVHALCSYTERSWPEAEGLGSPWLDRQFVCVSRGALHGLQGTCNLADLHSSLSVPPLPGSSCPPGQNQLCLWVISTMSWL